MEEETQSQTGEKETAAPVEEMSAAQEIEEGGAPYSDSFQFRQQFRVIAEGQSRAESRDRLLLLPGEEIDPAEMEMMDWISGFPADRFAAMGERLLHVPLFSGQAITKT